MQDALSKLVTGGALSEDEAGATFETILRGDAEDAQIGALLSLVQTRGPTADELVGAARAMRRHVTRVPVEERELGGVLVDTCGTGGAPKTFNVSTAAAIITASAEGPVRAFVAKHGNRSRSGRGSAEVLTKLGVNVDAAPETQARCLREAGVCFSFAIHHHPAMRHAAGPRKALGFPTIFNLLGPLTNPAGASRQVIGVYEERYAPLVAEALQRLGATDAIVAHGADGLDELTVCDETTLCRVRQEGVQTSRFDPWSIGIERAAMADLVASDLDDAASRLRRALSGEEGPARDMACLNAAAALVVAGAAQDLKEGFLLATHAVNDGAATETLAKLAEVSNSA